VVNNEPTCYRKPEISHFVFYVPVSRCITDRIDEVPTPELFLVVGHSGGRSITPNPSVGKDNLSNNDANQNLISRYIPEGYTGEGSRETTMRDKKNITRPIFHFSGQSLR
jgi:hypothetical protein